MIGRVMAAVFLLVATLPASVTATLPGRNGDIAVGIHTCSDSSMGCGSDDWLVGLASPGGLNQRVALKWGSDPAFSPKGRLIAVSRGGIVVVRPNATPIRRITRNFEDRSPSWSPDGSRLVFSNSGGIYIVPSSGGARRLVTRHGLDPSWSRRGEIAFSADGGGIRSTDARGGSLRVLTREGHSPDWSPRGDRLVFVRKRGQNRALFISNRDGRGLRRVFVSRRRIAAPAWSPDGRVIAFILGSAPALGSGGQVYALSPAGHDVRRLVPFFCAGLCPQRGFGRSEFDSLGWQPLGRR
jgi:Tol biopolymer transport system component